MNRWWTICGFAACLALLPLLAAGAPSPHPRVAVVDFQRVLKEAREARDFVDGVRKKAEEFQMRKAQLEDDIKDLLEQMYLLNEGSEWRQEIAYRIAEKNGEIELIRSWVKGAMEPEQMQFFENFFLKVAHLSEEYALRNGIDCLFRLGLRYETVQDFKKRGVINQDELWHAIGSGHDLYHDPRIDVTGDFIAFLDQAFGAGQSHRLARFHIVRDAWGVPHVFGMDDEDAFYGWGWMQAEQRLEPLLKNLLTATGEMAGVFGESWVESDRRVKTFGIPRLADAAWNDLQVPVRRQIDAFCEGINDYCIRNRKFVPAWARTVTPRDITAFAIWLSARKGWQQIYGEPSNHAATLLAVGGGRTENNGTLLAVDLRAPWTDANTWIEGSLRGHSLSVRGATLPGFPFLLVGASARAAWAFGDNDPDVADLYVEELRGGQYRHENEWRDLTREEIVIAVKTGDKTESLREFVYSTEHGPIIRRDGQTRGYAARLSGVGAGMLTLFYRCNAADTAAEIASAAAAGYLPWGEFVACDAQGNMEYFYNAIVPRRDPSLDHSQPLNGTSAAAQWGEPLDATELPAAHNPEAGYFIRAGNAPWTVSPNSGIDASQVSPFVFQGDDHSETSTRLEAMVSAKRGATLADAQGWIVHPQIRRNEAPANHDATSTAVQSVYTAAFQLSPDGVRLWTLARYRPHADLAGGADRDAFADYAALRWREVASRPVELYPDTGRVTGQRIAYGDPAVGFTAACRLRDFGDVTFEATGCDGHGDAFMPLDKAWTIRKPCPGDGRFEFAIPNTARGQEPRIRIYYRIAAGGEWMEAACTWDKVRNVMFCDLPVPESVVLGMRPE